MPHYFVLFHHSQPNIPRYTVKSLQFFPFGIYITYEPSWAHGCIRDKKEPPPIIKKKMEHGSSHLFEGASYQKSVNAEAGHGAQTSLRHPTDHLPPVILLPEASRSPGVPSTYPPFRLSYFSGHSTASPPTTATGSL